MHTVNIDGYRADDRLYARHVVYIDDEKILLTRKSFKYLVTLAWGLLTQNHFIHGKNGWVYKTQIEPDSNQPRYLYRLSLEIGHHLLAANPLYESNRYGSYRLNAQPSDVVVNLENLWLSDDHDIIRMAKELKDANIPMAALKLK
jgi:hypothetical protein